MSETTENAAPVAEQQVHPEVEKVQKVVTNAVNALLDVSNLLRQIPQVVAGNIALATELEKLKLDVVKDVQQS
jgi:predicted fused transcriptional regulator/phosphomethylpyrimidine kinase